MKNAANQGMPFTWPPPKLLLIMRMIILILTTSFMQLSAAGLAQTVSFTKTNATLEDVFRQIRTQTGYNVIAPAAIVKNKAPFSVDFKNTPLERVMQACIAGEDLTYSINKKTISVKRKTVSILDKIGDYLNNIVVIGNVFDKDGNPLPGASVAIKGKNRVVTTNVNGMFELRDVDENSVLVVSYIGYKSTEVLARPNMGIITLEPSTSKLDEIQVIAYGNTTKRLSTGATGGITAEEISRQPVLNPLEALKGRVAGLEIVSASGVPGAAVTVRIRGQNSLRNDIVNPTQSLNMNAPISGNSPLFIVDGVPISSAGVGLMSAQFFGGAFEAGVNPLNSLNPADIESMQVLKDAAATSIYGSLGANGVILITTKKGKSGQSKLDLNLSQGLGAVSRKMEMLNRRQYLDMRYEAYRNDGIDFNDPSVFDARDLKEWDTTGRDVDWQQELLGRQVNYTNAQLSISGGNEGTSFRGGGSLQRQTGVFADNQAYLKGSGNLSVMHRSVNNRFTANLAMLVNSDRNTLSREDLTQKALLLPPIGPSLYTSSGGLNWADYPEHPLAGLQGGLEVKTAVLSTSGSLGYKLTEHLKLSTNLGYVRQDLKSKGTQPSTAIDPQMLPFYGEFARTVLFDENINDTWNVEPQLEYHALLGKGKFNVLVGSTFQKRTSGYHYLDTRGYPIDEQMNNRGLASTVITDESKAEYLYSAIFGRLSYNLADKYIIDLTARRDGSSRFAKGNQFGNFGAVGAAWLFSEEKFVSEHLSGLSFGKLRLSYGTTGSDNIGDYMFLNTYSISKGVSPYDGIAVIKPQRLPSTDYAWEQSRKFDAELNLGFFKDRLLIGSNYYRNESNNQLVGYPLPSITGFQEITRNFPATVRNTGWEFTLSTANVKSKDFSWNSSINLTLSKNRLVSYPDLEISPYGYRYAVGYSTSILKTFDLVGVDPQTGLNVYQDEEGNPSLDPFNEIAEGTIIVDLAPKYFGGFSNTFNYKGLSLDVFIQVGSRVGMLMPDILIGQEAGNMRNQSLHYFNNRWRQAGDIALFPKFTSTSGTGNVIGNSEQNYGRISYGRLSNAALSYTLPSLLQKSLRMQNGRIYMQGQNLLTITDYKGLDPETLAASLPPLRIITFGLQVSF